MMKRIFLLCLIALPFFNDAQTRINYSLKIMHPDESERKYNMNLDVVDGMASFYDEELLKGFISVSKSNQLVFYNQKTKENQYIAFTPENQAFKIISQDPLQWNLVNEFKQVNQYKLQKATTIFGDRSWTAWFCPEIAMMDGPYKFRDLPGLIFEISDSENIFTYQLTEIEKLKPNTKKLNFDLNKTPEISWERYNKLLNDFFENPFLKQREQLTNGVELNIDDKDIKIQDLNMMATKLQKRLQSTFPPAVELDKFTFYKEKILNP